MTNEIEYIQFGNLEVKKNVKFKELDGYKIWNIQEKHRGKFVLNMPEPLSNIGNPEFIEIAAYYSKKEEVDKLKYVPGMLRCAKCKCVVYSRTIYMKSQTIGANNKPQECPNDCGPMWKVTYKDDREDLISSMEVGVLTVRYQREALEHAMKILKEQIEQTAPNPMHAKKVYELYEKEVQDIIAKKDLAPPEPPV